MPPSFAKPGPVGVAAGASPPRNGPLGIASSKGRAASLAHPALLAAAGRFKLPAVDMQRVRAEGYRFRVPVQRGNKTVRSGYAKGRTKHEERGKDTPFQATPGALQDNFAAALPARSQ